MKVVITGPRSADPPPGQALGFVRLEVDLEELPKVGETIILNSGSSYVVESVMWWVQGPENDDYYGGGDYKTAAEYETAHINVLPPDWGCGDRYATGRKDGRREAAADLAGLLKLAAEVDGDSLRALLGEWVKREITTGEER